MYETQIAVKMNQLGGSGPLGDQNSCCHRERFVSIVRFQPLKNTPQLLFLRHRSLGCILFNLLACHYILTVTAFMQSSHEFRSPLYLHPKQRYLSTIRLAIPYPLRLTRDQGILHRSSSASTIKLILTQTRLNASIQSPQNLNQQKQEQQQQPPLTQQLERHRHEENIYRRKNSTKRELKTLLRVGLPSILAGVFCYLVFPFLAMTLASSVTSAGALTVLSTDSSQFVQNFLSVSSLLFSILVGQTCTLW
jgi:hypothetical protein